MTFDDLADQVLVTEVELVGGVVAEAGALRGGVDEVGEHHRVGRTGRICHSSAEPTTRGTHRPE
jgi:hypothetical protein